MSQDKKGMRHNLTSYGDADFSLYLRKAFTKAMGYTEDSLGRPVIGIANTLLAPAGDTAGMRGYLRMFHDHVSQAGTGCDFDFLTSGKADKKTP